MLGSFMEEMQISPETFEMACLEGRNQTGPNNPLSFHQRLFQQIWAANDIRIFIRMMTQRNVELQLQALDLIERRQNSKQSDYNEGPDGSLAEFNEQGGDEELSHDLQAEKLLEESDVAIPVQGPSEAHYDPEEPMKKEQEAKADAVIADKFQRLNEYFDKEKSTDDREVKERQDYLRSQRDKILEIKKKTRARQLNETIRTAKRPSSAQAAQKLMDSTPVEELQAPSKLPDSSVQLRKLLAQRLRTEVVENSAKQWLCDKVWFIYCCYAVCWWFSIKCSIFMWNPTPAFTYTRIGRLRNK